MANALPEPSSRGGRGSGGLNVCLIKTSLILAESGRDRMPELRRMRLRAFLVLVDTEFLRDKTAHT